MNFTNEIYIGGIYMKICTFCNRGTKRLIKGYCSACYQSIKRSDGRYTPSPYGTVNYSPNGCPICHICGLAFEKLMNHVYYKHGMNEKEYKKKFGLNSHGLITAELKQKLRDHVYNNPKCITENLLQNGVKNRYYKGDPRCLENSMTYQELRRRKLKKYDIREEDLNVD